METTKPKKKYWSVGFHVDATGHIIVKAESEEAARKLAEDEFFPDNNNTELCDPQEIVSCDELDEIADAYVLTHYMGDIPGEDDED